MPFIKRLSYYLFGLSLGIVLILLFFNAKNTKCNYSPQKRVINDLSSKKWISSNNKIDSLKYYTWLKNGKINFSKSNTKLDSCKIYCLETTDNQKKISIYLSNCNKIVKILNIVNQ